MSEKYLSCHKCTCSDLLFEERAETNLQWKQQAGILLDHKNPKTRLGGVIGLYATCLNPECGYVWKVRKISEASELPNWPDKLTKEDVDIIRIAVDGKMIPEEEEINPIEKNIEEMLGITDSGKKKRGRPRRVA